MIEISVIVPVYYVEKYLSRCVDSILAQDYKDIEIILVDDGSPDRCPELCDEWAIKDKRIKIGEIEDAYGTKISYALPNGLLPEDFACIFDGK